MDTVTQHHKILATHALKAIRQTPTESWKHHGFGLLQISLTPAHRLNLWALELRTVDSDHGSWHTHRARIHATVLAGSVFNTDISPVLAVCAPQQRRMDVWEVPNNDGHPACTSMRGPFRRVGTNRLMGYSTAEITAGGSYSVRQGSGHCTESGPRGAVTSALVMDMRDDPATVFVAPGARPAQAFAHERQQCDSAMIDMIRDRCVTLLLEIVEVEP